MLTRNQRRALSMLGLQFHFTCPSEECKAERNVPFTDDRVQFTCFGCGKAYEFAAKVIVSGDVREVDLVAEAGESSGIVTYNEPSTRPGGMRFRAKRQQGRG